MRIGYFGGSFDPPHRGHLAVAKAARDAFALDRILLAPTGRQPLKPDARTAPFSDRLTMVRLLCTGEAGLEASDIDAPQADGLPNFTVDTLRQLQDSVVQTELGLEAVELFVIVGLDAFLDLARWKEPETLLTMAEWIVVSRPGFDEADLASAGLPGFDPSRVHLLRGVEVPVSATSIRRRLAQGVDCSEELTPAVHTYIRWRHLYGV